MSLPGLPKRETPKWWQRIIWGVLSLICVYLLALVINSTWADMVQIVVGIPLTFFILGFGLYALDDGDHGGM